MMKLITFILFFLPCLVFAQSWQWAKQYGSTTPGTQTQDKEYISKMHQDNAGNIYIAGRLLGSAKWEGNTMPNYGVGGRGFIAKYDADGNLLWRNLIGVNMGDEVRFFTVDDSENVYLSGVSFHQSVLPHYFRFNDSTINGSSGTCYLAKLNPNGTLAWLKLSNNAAVSAYELLNVNNKVYQRMAVDPSTPPLTQPLYNGFPILSPNKTYIVRIDGNTGNHIWTREFAGRGFWIGNIQVTPNEEFIEARYYDYAVMIGGNNYQSTYPTAMYVHSDSNLNAVSIKSATPAINWAQGCNFNDLRISNGSVYLSGSAAQDAVYDSYNVDFATVNYQTGPPIWIKCDLDGNVIWAYNPDSLSTPNGVGLALFGGIRIGKDGVPYFMARTYNKLKFMNVTYTPPQSNVLIPFILRVDSLGGNAELITTINTTTFNNSNAPHEMEINEKGEIFIAGEVKDNLIFGNTTIQNSNIGGSYSFDCFLAKYGYPSGDSNALVVPLIAQHLVATAVNGQQHIGITWQDVSNIEWGYKLYRSTNGSTWNSIVTLADNTTAYIDSAVVANTLYYYKVAAYNNMGEAFSNSDTALITTVSISAPVYQGQVSLYPSPNKGVFSLEVESEVSEQGIFIVWDMSGKLVVEEVMNVHVGSSKTSFHYPNLAKGAYIAQLWMPSGVWQEKMVVE